MLSLRRLTIRRTSGWRCFPSAARPSVPESLASLSQLISNDEPSTQSVVLSCAGGLAKTAGLDGAALGRGVSFSGGAHGVVLHFDGKTTTAGIVSRGTVPRVTEEAELQGALSLKHPEAPSTPQIELYTVSDLVACNGKGPSIFALPRPPLVRHRRPVSERLPSGISILETLEPVARGHRIGFVGPPASGKSYVAQALLASQPAGTAVVYACVAQQSRLLRQLQENSSRLGGDTSPAARHLVVCADPTQDPPSALYMLPIIGLQLAQSLLAQHRHVVLVLDDLSVIADCTAELSNKATVRSQLALPLSVPHVVAAALEQAGVFVDSVGEERSLTVASVFDMPPEFIPHSLQDLWKSAESSIDMCFNFDGTLAAYGHLPSIDASQLSLHTVAPVYLPPLLRQLRTNLTACLAEGKEREERMNLASELGLHDEIEDERELAAHDRIVKALLAQRQSFSPAEMAVVLHAASVYYFVGKAPTGDGITRFQNDVVDMIKEEQPELFGLLERMQELDDATAEKVLDSLAEVLVHNRYRFHLTQPEI